MISILETSKPKIYLGNDKYAYEGDYVYYINRDLHTARHIWQVTDIEENSWIPLVIRNKNLTKDDDAYLSVRKLNVWDSLNMRKLEAHEIPIWAKR